MTCPACGGQHLAGHPAGLLVFQHTLTCVHGVAEDQTKAADSTRAGCGCHPRIRPTTPTERALLLALGLTLPAALDTYVSHPTPIITRREWPTLTTTAAVGQG